MSAMAEMSRAIRETVEEYGPRLKDLHDDVLEEFVAIVGAFYLDLKDERERRARERDETA